MRTRWHGRGRRTLAWALGLLLLGQLGVGLVLDSSWAAVRYPDGAYVLAKARTHRRPPAVVCLGSSRLGMAFRAEEIRRQLRERTGRPDLEVFNATVPRGEVLAARWMLEHLLAEGLRPTVVVVEVSRETLSRRNPWLDWYIHNQMTWAEVPGLVPDLPYLPFEHCLKLAASRLNPVYTYRHGLRQQIKAWWAGKPEEALAATQPIPSGYEWDAIYERLTDPSDFPKRTQIMAGDVRSWIKGYRAGGLAEKAAGRLLDRCKAEGIEVVLLSVPATSAYRAPYTPEIEADFRACIGRLTRDHGGRFVECLDLLPDNAFWDGYHVLRHGGEAFSQKLTREVLAPACQARVPGDPAIRWTSGGAVP
jgi:hypothetical protein